MTAYTIETITAYVVTINGKRHRRTYRDPRGAANLVAWFRIADKFETVENLPEGDHIKFISEITERAGVECDCLTTDHYGDLVMSEHGDGCPLHDRKTGYFSRLRRRFGRAILAAWRTQS